IQAKAIEEAGPDIASQLALADFISRGELERHLRRMRQRYHARREVLLEALTTHLPEWRPSLAGGGLHVMVVLPGDVDEPSLVTAAARQAVGIEGLSLHRYTGRCPPGLVLGHAHLPEPAIERGVQLLARTV